MGHPLAHSAQSAGARGDRRASRRPPGEATTGRCILERRYPCLPWVLDAVGSLTSARRRGASAQRLRAEPEVARDLRLPTRSQMRWTASCASTPPTTGELSPVSDHPNLEPVRRGLLVRRPVELPLGRRSPVLPLPQRPTNPLPSRGPEHARQSRYGVEGSVVPAGRVPLRHRCLVNL
jgi:hypothetical protein